jgi:hypothetical protein
MSIQARQLVRTVSKRVMAVYIHLEVTVRIQSPGSVHRVLEVALQLGREESARWTACSLTENLLAIPWTQFVEALGAPAAGGHQQSGRENQQ